MNEFSIKKALFLLAFIAFAGVSCWATTESLHLLLPSWPKFMCWIVTIGFFIIASLGSKMILDSCNRNVYVENRGLKLILGVVFMILFWLVCSMPTNTHTFFYRERIADVVLEDLNTTKSYLMQLRDNTKTSLIAKEKKEELQAKVNAELIALNNEIDNMANPGFGTRAKSHLDNIAMTLGVAKIPTLSYKSASPSQIKALKEQYRTLVLELLKKRQAEIDENCKNPNENQYRPQAINLIKNIDAITGKINEMKTKGDVDNNIITQADVVLKNSYAQVKNYSQYIAFHNKSDEQLYKADEQITKTSRMLSVIDLWYDFLTGKVGGFRFVFWVIISVLVDLAAFVFFDLAFKNEN